MLVAGVAPVERDDAMVPGDPVEHATPDIVLGSDDIAVQEHDRRSIALLDVVQPDAIDGDELAGGRVVMFDLAGPIGVVNSRSRQCRR